MNRFRPEDKLQTARSFPEPRRSIFTRREYRYES
jgi:hypothetical protein